MNAGDGGASLELAGGGEGASASTNGGAGEEPSQGGATSTSGRGNETVGEGGTTSTSGGPNGSGGSPTCYAKLTELLVNGGFDDEPALTGWKRNTTIGWELYLRKTGETPTLLAPISEPYSLVMAGEHNVNEEFHQNVELPEGTFGILVSGYRMIILPADDEDVVSVRVVHNGEELADPLVISADSSPIGEERKWVKFEQSIELKDFPTNVDISLLATTDGKGYVSFAFDDISLKARHIECE